MTAPRRPAQRRLHRLLPDSWQGEGREARWRRSRGRRLLAALLCGVAVLGVVGAVRPRAAATHAVAVAAHDLPAGSRLTEADVREVRWSAADRVPNALPSASLPGTILTAPIGTGEPFTAARVRATRGWPAVPAGRVIVGVTAADTAIVRVLRAGDRVDLIDTGRGTTVASDVRVVAVTGGAGTSHRAGITDASPAEAPAVLVSVTPRQAAAVGSAGTARSAGVGGGIQFALRAGG